MWAFTGVKFRVAFQIVQTTETRLAGRTFVGLLLAVCEEMTLEVVVSREISRAIRTLVALGRGRLVIVLRISRQAHLALGRARIVVGQWPGKCHGAVAWMIAWIGCNGLVMVMVVVVGGLLLLLLLLLWLWRGCSFVALPGQRQRSRGRIRGSHGGRRSQIS